MIFTIVNGAKIYPRLGRDWQNRVLYISSAKFPVKFEGIECRSLYVHIFCDNLSSRSDYKYVVPICFVFMPVIIDTSTIYILPGKSGYNILLADLRHGSILSALCSQLSFQFIGILFGRCAFVRRYRILCVIS